MVGAKNALEFDVEKGFFFNKKMSNFFFNRF